MKRFFRKFRNKIKRGEDLPPPYEENDSNDAPQNGGRQFGGNSEVVRHCEVLDLLAKCSLNSRIDESSEVEYAEIEEMGLWHSTPLSARHKSKISLTWVLRENLEKRLPEIKRDDVLLPKTGAANGYRQSYNNAIEINRNRKCKQIPPLASGQKPRVLGRSEYYRNFNFNIVHGTNDTDSKVETCSEDTSGTTDHGKRRHRHRHRRRKKHRGCFGYDIKDIDSFLGEASLDRPGNIPVVVSCPSVLYETRGGRQTERALPLGTVVNAVFRRQQWLYVQTPHHHEGYVVYAACMPLGILPRSNSPKKKTPCWESSTDIYPQPCGNLTDTEKEHMRERTHSETRQRKPRTHSVYSEEYFDTLYLKTKSLCSNIDNYDEQESPCGQKMSSSQSEIQMTRQTLMVVSNDFVGDALENTLSVKQGDVVVLMQDASETDVDSEWFYVKRKDGKLGFIPAVVAGHGYI